MNVGDRLIVRKGSMDAAQPIPDGTPVEVVSVQQPWPCPTPTYAFVKSADGAMAYLHVSSLVVA